MNKLVRIIIDENAPPGVYLIGGVRIIDAGAFQDDGYVGRELRTTEVRCHGRIEYDRMRAAVETTDGLEFVPAPIRITNVSKPD